MFNDLLAFCFALNQIWQNVCKLYWHLLS